MTSKAYRTLTRAVRARPVLKYLGHVLLSLVGLALVPALFALVEREYVLAGRLVAAAGAFGVTGWLFSQIRSPSRLQTNEALVIASAAFFIAASAMTWPLMGSGFTLIDSFFESVSAITTTGLSTLPPDTSLTATHLFTRAWMQWYGGMVIIVLAVALMLPPGAASKNLAQSDAMAEGIVGSVRQRARAFLVVYVVLTVAGIVLLFALGMPIFDAVAHALAAISTGGFATSAGSLSAFDSGLLRWAVVCLSVLGAISFSLYDRVRHHGWRELLGDTGCRALFVSIGATTALVTLFMSLSGHYDWSRIAENAPLMAASAQTTAGFSSMTVADLDPASKAVLIASMFVGGDAGSTAGGIKLVRLLLILQLIGLAVVRTALPDRATVGLKIYGQAPETAQVHRMLTIVFLFSAVVLVTWLAFLAFGYPALDSLFDVVSATATTGLSTGVTSSDLVPPLKALLCLDMLMGRLEILAVLTLFFPATWIGRRMTEK